MRANIEKQIQENGTSGAVPPSGIPTGGPSGMPALDGQAPKVDCAMFAQVPSCSYVPAEVQAQCRQCKGE
jgi:hypothetical protein